MAALLDGIIFIPLLFIAKWVYINTSNIYILFAWITFMVFAPLIYSVFLHYKFGQTYGKWVMEVKVVDISESRNLTLTQSILRDSFYLVVALIGFFYYGFLLTGTGDKEFLFNNYWRFADSPVFYWTIIELMTMLTNSKRRSLHDFISKSIVARTKFYSWESTPTEISHTDVNVV